ACKFESDDSRFSINNKKPLPQGNKNRVLRGYYKDKPVIFKFYTDLIKPNYFQRKSTESLFLRHAAATNVVPKLVFESDNFILIEEIPGCSLEKKFSQFNLNFNKWLSRTAIDIGSAHACLANLLISRETFSGYYELYSHKKTLEQNVNHILETSLTICKELEGFHGLVNTIDYINEYLEEIFNQPRIIYKYDNNLGNIIVNNRGFQRFIDFEECYEGTKAIYLGAIFDCLHQIPWNLPADKLTISQCLPWKYIKHGYELYENELIDSSLFEQIVAMAMFNAWFRITRTWKANLDMSFWIPRFRKRLETYWDMIT
ncbi:MAG: hypothetical protein AAFR37_14570, partial [Cyanobacteria bacterium J06628_3]